MNLARSIEETRVEAGAVAIFWLAQAGFVFKNSAGKIVYIDPYFSDVVERVFGFKRMMSCPIATEDVKADLLLCTHEHLDHMDTDALPAIARNTTARFAGPTECIKEFRKLGIPDERCLLLEEGTRIEVDGIQVTGVYADHGEYAPDALGLVVDMGGIRIYHTGDTAYRPEQFRHAIEMRPDVLLPCINGAYGNLDSEEAAMLVRDARPRVAIASHFWMFVAHNGNPATFLENCRRLAPDVHAMVMQPGERFIYAKAQEQRSGA